MDALLLARQAAMAQQKLREMKRKQNHEGVAVLLEGKRTQAAVIRYAQKQVKKWKRHRLCSQDFIQDWTELLQSPHRAAALLRDDTPFAIRMRQNSPFAAYLANLHKK